MKKSKRKKGVFIHRSGKQFFLDEVAPNGKVLQHSENVKRKQSAFKNLISLWKLLFDVFSAETHVTDEKGDHWVYNNSGKDKGKFTNSSAYMRKKLPPSLIPLAKHAAKKAGKDIVIKGPRGGTLLDTRNKKAAKKK